MLHCSPGTLNERPALPFRKVFGLFVASCSSYIHFRGRVEDVEIGRLAGVICDTEVRLQNRGSMYELNLVANHLPQEALIGGQSKCPTARNLLRSDWEVEMTKMTIFGAAAVVIFSSAFGHAEARRMIGMGASEFSPGDRMRDAGGPGRTLHGASEFTPGDRMRDLGGPRRGMRGASEFSPGDLKNDMRRGRH